MYAVQNDSGIKFKIELYIKVIFVGQGVGIQKAYPEGGIKLLQKYYGSRSRSMGHTYMTSHTLDRVYKRLTYFN